MISEEVLEEVGRQLDLYASTYADIGQINKEIVSLDMNIAQRRDELELKEKEQQQASEVINGLISDYEDEESRAQINSLISEKLGTLIFGGMFE